MEFGELAPGAGPSATKLTGEAIADKIRKRIAEVKAETGRELSYAEAANHVMAAESGE